MGSRQRVEEISERACRGEGGQFCRRMRYNKDHHNLSVRGSYGAWQYQSPDKGWHTAGEYRLRCSHHPNPSSGHTVHLPPLDPARVECTAFRPQSYKLCYKTANDLHQLIELILAQLSANDVADAILETLPTTPQMFPDGTVVYGPAGFASIAADWAGSNDFSFISVTAPEFRYRPLDTKTVVAFGIVYFTFRTMSMGQFGHLRVPKPS